MPRHRLFLILIGIVIALVIFILLELVVILRNGSTIPRPVIPRTQTYGSGPRLTYVVMGDSTAVSQGSTYEDGFAVASSRHLARDHTVLLVNTAMSGARLTDVVRGQLPDAVQQRPSVVLLAAGANDATHFTSGHSINQSLQTIINDLKTSNPQVKIILTGSPAMDSVSRFPFGAKQLMGLRTHQVNAVFDQVIAKSTNVSWAPIARDTQKAFLDDPTLFAADKFHPNARGYALWTPVIIRSLDTALGE